MFVVHWRNTRHELVEKAIQILEVSLIQVLGNLLQQYWERITTSYLHQEMDKDQMYQSWEHEVNVMVSQGHTNKPIL